MPALVGFVALQGGWKPYTLRPGIRVDLPTPPVEQPIDPEDPTTRNWLSIHQETNIIVVTHGTYKDDATRLDQVLLGMLHGAQEASKGKILAQKDILLSGWPGVEYRLQSADGLYGICRIYAMKGELASILIGSNFTKKLDAPATKLFASVKLPAKAGQGPYKVAGPEFKTYAVGDTGVSIDLPNPPEVKTIEVPDVHKRKLHQHLSQYINRVYSIGYMEFEEDEIAGMSPEDIADDLRETHQHIASGLGVKTVRPVATKFGGRDAFRSTYPFQNGIGQARVESVLIGRRAFFAMALTPSALAKNPEIDKFFASIKVE